MTSILSLVLWLAYLGLLTCWEISGGYEMPVGCIVIWRLACAWKVGGNCN